VETRARPDQALPAQGRCEYYAPVRLQGAVPESVYRRIVPVQPCGVHEGDILATLSEAPA